MILDIYDCNNKNTSVGLSCSKEKKSACVCSIFFPNAKYFFHLQICWIKKFFTSIDSNVMQWVANHLTNKLKSYLIPSKAIGKASFTNWIENWLRNSNFNPMFSRGCAVFSFCTKWTAILYCDVKCFDCERWNLRTLSISFFAASSSPVLNQLFSPECTIRYDAIRDHYLCPWNSKRLLGDMITED
jgi:hypothetical protein